MRLTNLFRTAIVAVCILVVATLASPTAKPDGKDKGLLRLLVFVKKQPDLTYDQFYDHWINVHAPKVAPWIVKHNIKTYTQVCLVSQPSAILIPSSETQSPERKSTNGMVKQIHTRPEIKAQWSNASFEFDGVAEFEFTDLNLFFGAVVDPYYAQVIAPDEDTFLDKSGSTTSSANSTMGIVKPVVKKGKIVLGQKASDDGE